MEERRHVTSDLVPRHHKVAGGAFSDSQNRAILITALTCSCISFCTVLVALRLFIIKRRTFRHQLIMHLIMSNTLKGGLYFVFPIVVFAAGPVQSESNWCQASGFLLQVGIEAADMSILIIALHAILYIFRPTSHAGEGGLYPYRNWIYPLWLGPPLLAASLAFIKDGRGYVTAGTFCYLPKRPYWYRLALSWVPRYLIIGVILAMYIWLYLYVHIKFRGFDNLGITGSSNSASLESRQKSSIRPDDIEREAADRGGAAARPTPLSPLRLPSWRTGSQEPPSQHGTPTEQLEPWDHMNFITTKALQYPTPAAVAEEDEPPYAVRGSGWSGDTQTPVTGGSGSFRGEESQKPSGVVTPKYNHDPSISKPAAPPNIANDPLRQTRIAIRKQLRYMFVYPAVYVVMWSFPFAQQALYYNDYYVQNPIFWLNLMVSMMLSLQAGVDSVIFSLMEKTRKGEVREEGSLGCSMARLWCQFKTLLGWGPPLEQPPTQPLDTVSGERGQARRTPHWWEAEGRRRKDSIWLGTSTFSDSTFSPEVSRNRSRSPEKTRRISHSRTRSSVQAPLFVPTLEPIPTEPVEQSLPLSSGDMRSSTRPGLTPVSSNVGGRSGRRSSQSVRAGHEPGSPSKMSSDSSRAI